MLCEVTIQVLTWEQPQGSNSNWKMIARVSKLDSVIDYILFSNILCDQIIHISPVC